MQRDSPTGSRRSCATSEKNCTKRSASAGACCSKVRRARCSTWTTAPIRSSPRRPASASGAPHGVGIGPRAIDRGPRRHQGVRHARRPRPVPERDAGRPGLAPARGGEEYGATTGRPRRCGWLDVPALRYAARINGLDGWVVTKLDVLDAFEEIRAVEAYEIDGRTTTSLPTGRSALGRVRPVWRAFRAGNRRPGAPSAGTTCRLRLARTSNGSRRRPEFRSSRSRSGRGRDDEVTRS